MWKNRQFRDIAGIISVHALCKYGSKLDLHAIKSEIYVTKEMSGLGCLVAEFKMLSSENSKLLIERITDLEI